MKTVAVIVAAGRGTRAGSDKVPKQYRVLDGQPVLAHTIRKLAEHGGVDGIVVVIHPDDLSLYEALNTGTVPKLFPPVFGGNTRQESVRAGLSSLKQCNPVHVLIHDAARPFIASELLDRVAHSLLIHEGVVPALPVADTIKVVRGEHIESTVDRRGLWSAQTPQGFDYLKILKAHELAFEAGKADFTDDASLGEWQGLDIIVVGGDSTNVKLTTEQDFKDAEERLGGGSGEQMAEARIGQGFDVHAFVPGDHVVLCGLKIPHVMALTGHSDADVALHALTDAILGTISDGDIGAHFPPGDPQWRGVASSIFLREAMKRLTNRNGSLVNVDITIICESPKIGPHRDAMRESVAEITGLDFDRISIKATTTEGLGFAGRREGIAAQAMALARFS